jgi:hypothetical protein
MNATDLALSGNAVRALKYHRAALSAETLPLCVHRASAVSLHAIPAHLLIRAAAVHGLNRLAGCRILS